jgi:PAS domain S-box-containing protein
VLVLWATSRGARINRDNALDTAIVLLLTVAVGLTAFSPLIEEFAHRGSFAFLCVVPLTWAALRCGRTITATVVLILAGFAIWGTALGSGPFARETPGEAFLPVLAFMLSTSVLGLAVSAAVETRRSTEDVLRRQEQNLRTIFSEALVGIAETDATGRFTLINDRFCDIVGRPASELLTIRLQDIADPDDLDLVGYAVQTAKSFVVESRYVLPGGARVWARSNVSVIADPEGRIRRIVTVAEDVTERREAQDNLRRAHDQLERRMLERTADLQESTRVLTAEVAERERVEEALKVDIEERRKAQEALAESERRYRLFIEAITDCAFFMLDPDGNISHWNTGAERILGFAADEITGASFGRFYTEEDQQRGEPARALKVAAYEGKHVAEGWRRRRDASLFWANVVIEAIHDELGALVGFAQVTRDDTEQRQAEAALERAKEQLAQSQKMEALGQLTGSIAHDFNNLLMIVSGHAQLLRRRLSEPKQLQAIEAIHTAASRGESLTRQLLSFSRRQPLSPVVVDLRERVEAVREMLVGSLRGNIALECDIPPGAWPVEVDIAELELALVNVAVNARDAMPGAGSIRLSARNVTLSEKDKVGDLVGDYIALALSDTGVGIAADVLPRIFEPFFTTKGLGKGTGLGLAQVYGFAHQSGGTVIAASTVGSGTTITIYLPRSHAVPVRSAEAVGEPRTVRAEGTVLVVEDNAEVAEVTSSLVEQLGFRTVRSENAADALNRLQQGERVNLVLSDIVMPGAMNGIALAQVIARRYPDIPILLASGYSDMVQAAESRFVVLRKPFQLPMLEKAVRDAIERNASRHEGGSVVPFSRTQGTSG